MKRYYVYILASKPNGTVYVGVTNNLERRMFEHKNEILGGFTAKYNVKRLVYFEETNDIGGAISREKEIKGWIRKRKLNLINKFNPEWKDLDSSLCSE